MIQTNMATAKVTIRTAIREQQSEKNTAAIPHKKQAGCANDTQKNTPLITLIFTVSRPHIPTTKINQNQYIFSNTKTQ